MAARAGGAVSRAARVARQWLHARLHGPEGGVRAAAEDGFILLESMIAISVVSVVMAAVGAEFVGGMVASSQQRAQQGAVQVAGSTVEQIRSLHASDLVTGRDSAGVTSQFATAVTQVQPWLAGMDRAVDSSAVSGSGATAAVPTAAVTVTPGTVPYTVNQYLGYCSVPTSTSGPKDCVVASTLNGAAATRYVRAVVAVTWTGQRCGSGVCAYVTSTLLSAAADRTFRVAAPAYSAPAQVLAGAQTSVVGDPVSLQLKVKDGTGVPTYTWAQTTGSLPTGLAISTTGLISGTVQAPAGTYSATVRVTDAFVRTDDQTITWTVKPPLTLADPGPQAAIVNQTTTLTLSASGGVGTPYTYSILNGSLPPGLTLAPATGVISGKPTMTGVYTVVAQVADSSTTRTDIEDFTWTVDYPPIAASTPSRQVDTQGTAIRPLTLSASGGSGSYAWSDPTGSLPPGLSVSTAGVVTGTPTTLTGGSSVTLTVRDAAGGNRSATVSFVWAVVAKPTVTAPGSSFTVTVGQAVSLALSTSCPNSPCSYSLDNGPGGLSIDTSGVVSGTVAGAVTTYGNVTVTVTDADGATGRSAVFTVVVRAAPTVSGSAQSDTVGGTVSVALTTTCPNGPCSYTLNNGPAGLSVSASGVIAGTVGGSPATYSAVTVTVTDVNGVASTSSPFTWVVYPAPGLSGLAVTTIGENSTPSVAIGYTCAATPCTIALSGTLASSSIGLGLSAAAVTTTANGVRTLSVGSTSGTVYVNGLVSTSAVTSGTSKTYGVSLDITDSNGISPSTSSATWTAYSTPTLSSPGPVTTSQNGTPSKALVYACPTSSCTVAVTGLPAGVGLSGSSPNTTTNTLLRGTVNGPTAGTTIYLNGRVSGSAAKTTYLVTVTITSGTTTTSSSGIWTVQ